MPQELLLVVAEVEVTAGEHRRIDRSLAVPLPAEQVVVGDERIVIAAEDVEWAVEGGFDTVRPVAAQAQVVPHDGQQVLLPLRAVEDLGRQAADTGKHLDERPGVTVAGRHRRWQVRSGVCGDEQRAGQRRSGRAAAAGEPVGDERAHAVAEECVREIEMWTNGGR